MQDGHKVVCAAEDTAVREYAESLITPLGAGELVVALMAPNCGFHALLEFFTRSTVLLEDRTAVSAVHLYPGGLQRRVARLLYPPLAPVTAGTAPSSGD